jgi:Domain of unknown function (DUF5060)
MTDINGRKFMSITNKLITVLLIIFLFLLTGCSQKTKRYTQGVKPEVTFSGINTGTVKKYEKFEVIPQLKNVEFENPYDPADIDVYALFTSPSGEIIKINGFFDNYRGADKWKIRFSPKETGEYKYRIYVNDGSETGESRDSAFTAVKSEHHGWIKPSEKNPHYFTHDDGTSYYAVGVYAPWGQNEEMFKTYADHNANLMAIWDISYGGFVNGTGIIENELGRYNQEKLGRIDSMLTILERDNIKLMFAIWPHDLFSKTVWAAQWKQNPYSKITSVENVYSDSLAWEYQKLKYRYLIARFAHSRSWGIWELINEMDGTDGWAKGHHQEAYVWVKKCEKYFSENDPYHHPVTASFSGGFDKYQEPLYELTDIPNIHLYPAQGWVLKYPDDTLRSDMYNFAWASKRFWDRFEKPAIFGEAGADLTYYKPETMEYHISYHNQIWASLTNGLSGIPVWWDYPILNEQDWQQLKHLSAFVSDIDFANLPYKPVQATAEGTDIFIMDAGDKAFGWARTFLSHNVTKTKLTVLKPGNGDYTIKWFDTWSGNIVKSEKVNSGNGFLELIVPELTPQNRDIAFKISKI